MSFILTDKEMKALLGNPLQGVTIPPLSGQDLQTRVERSLDCIRQGHKEPREYTFVKQDPKNPRGYCTHCLHSYGRPLGMTISDEGVTYS